MKLLVTTIKRGFPIEESGAAYLVDWKTQKIVKTIGMLPLKARIPRNPRGGIRGLRGACIGNEKIFIASNDTISVLNMDLELQGTIESRLFCNLHELKIFKDDYYALSCGIDAVIDFRQKELVYAIPYKGVSKVGSLNYDNIDRHGLTRPNSLEFRKDGTLLVTAATDSLIRVIDRDRGLIDTIDIGGVQTPHSLTRIGNTYYVLSSKDGSILRGIGLEGEKPKFSTIIFKDEKPWWFRQTALRRWGWLRGMAGYSMNQGHILFVGSSPYARIFCIEQMGGSWKKTNEMRLSNCKSEAVSSVVIYPEDVWC